MTDPDADDACPIVEEVRGALRREYLARVRLIIGTPAIVITQHVVLGGAYVMSPEHLVDEISLAEARQLHDALGEAIAAYEVRALAELDTEPEPYIEPDILTREEFPR